MNIHDKVLKKISPSQKEIKQLNELIERVKEVVNEVSGLEAVAVGSTGKMTWLSGDHDIDIFILFPKDVDREELEEKGLKFGADIAKKLKAKMKVKYAEHPYTQVNYKGYDIDIVPCYNIEHGDNIISAVDRSPLHLDYVLRHLKENQQDEVRLLKQFMKGVGVYGSDAKNLGFSGYVCELLVIKYGSFEKTLKAAKNWYAQERVNMRDEVKRYEYKDQPLVVIDPTDRNRNAAAIVSGENFQRFIEYADRYLAKPSLDFFLAKPAKLSMNEMSELKKRDSNFIVLEMKHPDLIDDILYFQIRRALRRLTKLLEHNEFKMFRVFDLVDDKNMYLVLEMEIWDLPPVKKMVGPTIFSRKHTREFNQKYDRAYVEEITWMADRPREHITAEALLTSFLKQSEIKLTEGGIPKKIVKQVKQAKLGTDFYKIAKKFPREIKRIYFD